MPKPIDTFEVAIDRANHLITLYKLVHDTRQRAVRSDWATNFNSLMHWPRNEKLVRIDGENRDSLLIIKKSLKIERSKFVHDYASEVLRSAIVAGVSAVDRYFHDIVVLHCWKFLSGPEENVPNELTKISISVISAKRAVAKARNDKKSRPGHIIKKAIQKHLHQNYTFQNPNDIIKATKMLGVENFWAKVAEEMPGNSKAGDIVEMLRKITKRRNLIVHEADLILKTKGKKHSLREISLNDASEFVTWIRDFVYATDTVISAAI